jgi:D-arginine dehydrogenase
MPSTTHTSADIAVIGAGIAGASVAAALAGQARVILIEMEAQPGFHTTGRSAAVFAPSYGPGPIRSLTRASAGFYHAPPAGFADAPLLTPRPILMIARDDQQAVLDNLVAAVAGETPVELLGPDQIAGHHPLVRPGYAAGAMLDRDGHDIDVNALHRGYLRAHAAAGGVTLLNAEVTAMTRERDQWHLTTRQGVVSAPVVVNAAGAWAQVIGDMAGAEPIGLTPKRRTAATIAEPAGTPCAALPITIDVQEQFYLKPESGRLLISPADETPSAPCDAQPEEIDIAICADRIMTAFDLDIRRIDSKWAGLRSFVADKSPVAGYSATAPGFYWLAGQGGYGIQSAPALSRAAAADILHQPLPDDIAAHGLRMADLAPARLKATAPA